LGGNGLFKYITNVNEGINLATCIYPYKYKGGTNNKMNPNKNFPYFK